MRFEPLPSNPERAAAYELLANAELARLERMLRETAGEPLAVRASEAARLVCSAERCVAMARYLRRAR